MYTGPGTSQDQSLNLASSRKPTLTTIAFFFKVVLHFKTKSHDFHSPPTWSCHAVSLIIDLI